jgi:large repetitive protein
MRALRNRSSFRAVMALVALAAALTAAVGPAGAGPVGCGAVLKSDTTLDSDLVNCPRDGLVIGAAGITIDLNGHTVSGTRRGGSAGLRNHGFHDVIVKNGTVKGFHEGLVLKAAKRNLLTGLTVEENALAGISLNGAHHNRIASNRVYVSFGHGILLRGSHGNRVLGNEASGRGLIPPSAGIGLYGSRGNRIQGNRAINSLIAIALYDSHQNALFSNNAAGSNLGRNLTGIAVFNSDKTLIRRNDVSSSRVDGIFVGLGSSGTSIERNIAGQVDGLRGADDGIDVNDPSAFIAGNTANGNGDLGIEAMQAVQDGGGNRASGNGNPRQCVGVSCSA